ncbi:MAG: response regulator transcription factor [Vicinamibacteria bacterium]
MWNVVRETTKSSAKTKEGALRLSAHAPGGKVYVVDDDPAVRASLSELFRSVRLAVATYPSSQAFLDEVLEDVPSCLILDLNLPGPNGLDLQEQLRREGRGIPIIFITGYGDVSATVRAMKSGALDFLEKPFSDDALLSAVSAALARDEGARAARSERAVIQGRFEELTPRERQVMALVVQGLLNKQIASELGAAEQTIKIHRGRVMTKMRAQSVPDLVRMAEMVRDERTP